jgi:hypothetical protein
MKTVHQLVNEKRVEAGDDWRKIACLLTGLPEDAALRAIVEEALWSEAMTRAERPTGEKLFKLRPSIDPAAVRAEMRRQAEGNTGHLASLITGIVSAESALFELVQSALYAWARRTAHLAEEEALRARRLSRLGEDEEDEEDDGELKKHA